MWHHLADRLGLPKQLCQLEVPSSEFVDWVKYYQEEEDRKWDPKYNPLFQYLAQIACETRRSYVEHPGRVHLRDFLLKFEDPKKKAKAEVTKPQTPEEASRQPKAYFFGALGLPVPEG